MLFEPHTHTYLNIYDNRVYTGPTMNYDNNIRRKNNNSMVTLDVRISCDTFWNYKFNIPIRINDYYSDVNNRSNNGNVNTRSETCEIGNIGRSDPSFLRLESYLVDYVIQYIYDDLVQKKQYQDIPVLLKKTRKFHIHGRTLEDILFPGSRNTDTHSTPDNMVYICTHC